MMGQLCIEKFRISRGIMAFSAWQRKRGHAAEAPHGVAALTHVQAFLPNIWNFSRHIKISTPSGVDIFTIEKYGQNGERMYQLFSAIEELPCERRKKAVEKFLSLNADPAVFEQLPLEPSHWGGTGSMIPYMQERIEYLRSLLPLVSGIKYLKQKQRIEREIDCWKESIHSEEVRELLESWYH